MSEASEPVEDVPASQGDIISNDALAAEVDQTSDAAGEPVVPDVESAEPAANETSSDSADESDLPPVETQDTSSTEPDDEGRDDVRRGRIRVPG
ncbi:MAG: hypothetical protein R2843_09795 [Thermomicrobiales bacterium]